GGERLGDTLLPLAARGVRGAAFPYPRVEEEGPGSPTPGTLALAGLGDRGGRAGRPYPAGAGRVGEPPRARADRVVFGPETVPQEALRRRGSWTLAGGSGVVGRGAGEGQEPREGPPLRRFGRRPGAGERQGVVPRRGDGL
ncbi:MAG: hypothetical protein AVDCRST_MAG58-1279, partial [uncultured Rubrobacteraceae bacterium]